MKFSKKIFTNELTIDTLKYARDMYYNFWKNNNPYFSSESIRIFTCFKNNYKKNFP